MMHSAKCMPNSFHKSLQRGFTLLELMAVMAIVAILASIAIPSMQSLIDSSKISAHREALAGAVKLARSEAVTRGCQCNYVPVVMLQHAAER